MWGLSSFRRASTVSAFLLAAGFFVAGLVVVGFVAASLVAAAFFVGDFLGATGVLDAGFFVGVVFFFVTLVVFFAFAMELPPCAPFVHEAASVSHSRNS